MASLNNMPSADSATMASHQWAKRPNDERFLSMSELKAAVHGRRQDSFTTISAPQQMRISASEGELSIDTFDVTAGSTRRLQPSHWAFGQLAGYAQAPASYLRKLPAELAAINLQWGLEHNPVRDQTLVLGQQYGLGADDMLRAMTSPRYGRIWDEEVVEAVERANSDGRWVIPSATYTEERPRRATTLYASDRDVFIFLVDDKNAIDVGGEQLYRGFYTWNSEVGSTVFGLTTFLYRYICDNRIIWGMSDVKELRIRHTGGAPDRFAYEGQQYLRRYAEESSRDVEASIKAAQAFEVPNADKAGSGWERWLIEKGFSQSQAKGAVQYAQAEEGEARSLWDIINGITANARSIPHTDERVKVEAAAGNLMRYAR